jgi:hypothetical protein
MGRFGSNDLSGGRSFSGSCGDVHWVLGGFGGLFKGAPRLGTSLESWALLEGGFEEKRGGGGRGGYDSRFHVWGSATRMCVWSDLGTRCFIKLTCWAQAQV